MRFISDTFERGGERTAFLGVSNQWLGYSLAGVALASGILSGCGSSRYVCDNPLELPIQDGTEIQYTVKYYGDASTDADNKILSIAVQGRGDEAIVRYGGAGLKSGMEHFPKTEPIDTVLSQSDVLRLIAKTNGTEASPARTVTVQCWPVKA